MGVRLAIFAICKLATESPVVYLMEMIDCS